MSVLLFLVLLAVAAAVQLVVHEASHVIVARRSGRTIGGFWPYPHWTSPRADTVIPFWKSDFWKDWKLKKEAGLRCMWGRMQSHDPRGMDMKAAQPRHIAPMFAGLIVAGVAGLLSLLLWTPWLIPFVILGLGHVADFWKDFFMPADGPIFLLRGTSRSDGKKWRYGPSGEPPR